MMMIAAEQHVLRMLAHAFQSQPRSISRNRQYTLVTPRRKPKMRWYTRRQGIHHSLQRRACRYIDHALFDHAHLFSIPIIEAVQA